VAQKIPTPRPAPGRHPLSREFIAQHQRARIIGALAEETAARGYRAVTVADIVRRAGIARNTFYDNFGSKEDCFLAAQQYGAEALAERILAAANEEEGWPQRVGVGLGACLEAIAGSPALARLCIVEAPSAGPASVERHEQSLQAFVPFFRVGRQISPHGRELPDTLEEAVVGGIFWIIYQRIILDETEDLAGLLPELLEFALTPYLGFEAARQLARPEPDSGA
jgi:AcrR family transcriptional regulator